MIDLHPSFIDAMIAGGVATHTDAAIVLCAVQAALWKAFMGERRPRQVDDAPPLVAGVAPVAPESPVTENVTRNAVTPETVTRNADAPKSPAAIRQKRWRDKHKQPHGAATVTPVTASVTRNAPLSHSLKEDSNSDSERESGSVTRNAVTPVTRNAITQRDAVAVACKATSVAPGLMTLPLDWQPNDTGAKLNLKRHGEIAAADCLANFRDHFTTGDGKDERRTATQWQSRFLKWVRNERRPLAGEAQRSLPLMNAGTPASTSPAYVIIHRDTPEAATLEAHLGKRIPWGDRGVWQMKASEWPPPDRQEASHG
jgi:hypothetical protein